MASKGFAQKIRSLFASAPLANDGFYDELSDSLVEGDLGASEAFALVEELRASCGKDKISRPEEVEARLASLLSSRLLSWETVPLQGKLTVVLLLGVNGVGKTTTAAKLCDWYSRNHGRAPLLAAADTFRAAAIDQLKIHGERLGVPVVAHKHGGDPAAVVYDAIEAARSRGCDLVVADTAGRMHTKTGLVEELKKIDRVVAAKAADAEYLKFIVLDATTGRNALAQAETFHSAVSLDAAILTKYDSSARGGIAFSLASVLSLPTAFVCAGESYADIRPFAAVKYAREFVRLE
ncbi:MAG TPA: signal recognition particle-docking protein FtsY [Treponema sp.]|nr:MAG: signal recognition particle-docking protein FtsY [Treponema sp. GWC1_61_84]OHE71928.1 MAG: signal recognition particle-docking protein FtsY [Treponema sp. RIFOXYC1_FULL_61_9]HCM25464.1 signal recognition particle-docking protein FtsY [Treponema sp.]